MFGDAASADCTVWRDTFIRAGFAAPIYARRFDATHAGICAPLDAYTPRPNDVLLFHYTTWTETADFLLDLGRPIVLMYHNVTPPSFFAGLDARLERETRLGRERVAAFATLSPLATAKSAFSLDDLTGAGFRRTLILPVRLDFDLLDRECDEELRRQVAADGLTILTVGRVVPQKRVDDLVRLLAYVRARIDPAARLYCVGAHDENGPYQWQLGRLARDLGVAGAVQFTGQVPHAHRGAYYRGCRVFVTMSEHEGFCVPLVEAMHLGLPVIAYAGGAIPETLGDGGVLIKEKRLDIVAEVVGQVAVDGPLRRRLIEKGRGRASAFAPAAVEARLAEALIELDGLDRDGRAEEEGNGAG